jgi:nucleotide-binding universal stress UspA family protein
MSAVFSRLLLATEHTEFDAGAEAVAFAMARRCAVPLAGVMPVSFNAEFEAVAPELAARADAEVSARREQFEAQAASQGVALAVSVRHGDDPFAEIVAEAHDRAADLLVIRRRGKRGLLANLLIGDMVNKVIAHSPCSVLVVPRRAHMWSTRVLVGLDPLAPDATLVEEAARLAAECGLPLRIVCVVQSDNDRRAADDALAAAMAQGRSHVAGVEGDIHLGRPHEALIDDARHAGADLLIVGRRGSGSIARAWIGGVAQKVIGLADCPVLVHVNPHDRKAHTP